MRTRLFALLFMLSTLASLLGGCGASTGANATTPISAAAALGKLIFQDTNLSASGQMSCQSCHDPNNGHGSPFLTPVAMGGALGNLPGLRNPPAIRYLKYNGAFTIAADGTPSGGFFWDGRVNSLMDQAKGPFLNPVEMANNAPTDVIQKIRMASYAGQFKQVFGPAILDIGNEAQAFNLLAYALERYQVESPEFAPFTSKFDAVMQGKANFSDMQARGFALFNNPTNSAPSALDTQTNIYTVSHAGLTTRTDLCGRFKVPSLRNVQTRTHFFHNGIFTTLEQVVNFYVTRDTDPFGNLGGTAWYPSGDKFDDMPIGTFMGFNLKNNVNTLEAPYNRTLGAAPALNALEQQDLIAFLKTLTDGYF